MRIILNTTSEFGNRFGPLISLYRICKKYNIEFLIYWPIERFNVHDKSVVFKCSFNTLFKNDKIKCINYKTYLKYCNNSKSYKPKYSNKRPIKNK